MKFPAWHDSMQSHIRSAALPAILLFAIAVTASSSTPSALRLSRGNAASPDVRREVKIQPFENAHYKNTKDLPCLGNAVEDGNPDTEASTVLIKMEKGCAAEWHYHTAETQLMIVEGQLTVQTFSTPAATLGPGGYFLIPSKERFQYSCGKKSKCVFFLALDRPFDFFPVKPAN